MNILDKLRDILSYGKDTLSAISDLTDDEDFRNNLGKAGGLLALVSTALEVTDKIIEQSQAPKVKAYNRLSKYVLRVTRDSLMDSGVTDKIDKQLVRGLRKKINESFDKAEDKYHDDLKSWNSYVINHQL